jgi:hypothetical protein
MARKYTKWPQNLPNGHKIYQMATKFTKWPQNLPNGHKTYQMAIKHIKWPQNMYTKRPQNIPTFFIPMLS